MNQKKVKNIIAALAILWTPLFGVAQAHLDQQDRIFSEVIKEGLVDYKKANGLAIELTALDSTYRRKGLNNSIAELINWYNIRVILMITQHPEIKSVKDIPTFFDQDEPSLNAIESHLRSVQKDPLLHFALVCGAQDCPPITDKAFRGVSLRVDLEKAARTALNDSDFIRVDTASQTVRISQIFQWYAEDFPKGGQALINWMNLYRTQPIPEDYKVGYYEYDWRLNYIGLGNEEAFNLTQYTPSKLLGRGQYEIQLFNNLYTQTGFRNDQGDFVSSGVRENYFTQFLSFLIGVGDGGRVNVGFDYVHRSVSIGDTESMPYEVLRFANGELSRSQPAQIGPKIKFTPSKKVANLSVQSTYYIPLYHNGEAYPWFDYDRYLWWNRVFYDIKKAKWQVFTEADLLLRFKTNGFFDQPIAEVPVSAFLSYFPSNDWTLYGMTQYSHTLFSGGSYFLQSGAGFKYRPTKRLEFEVLYTNFLASKNQGAGATANLGIRYIH